MPAPDYENDLVFPPRHDKTAYELQLDNNKLRGLLKECNPYIRNEIETIKSARFCNCDWAWKTFDLLARVNAVIGESEEW